MLGFIGCMIIIIFMLYMMLVAFYSITKEIKSREEIENSAPKRVLVPDNVKKESQAVSTQKNDAKIYDVNTERNSLLSKGYRKIGESTYQKTEISNSKYDNYVDEYINEDDKEIDPINNKRENDKPISNNEDDDDPIKDM